MHPRFEKRLEIVESSRNQPEQQSLRAHCSKALMNEFLLRMYAASENLVGVQKQEHRHAQRLLIALDSILMAHRTGTATTEAEEVIAEALEAVERDLQR